MSDFDFGWDILKWGIRLGVAALVISVPLAIWKAVELIIWLVG
jgi:hypothetical protein